MTTVRLSFIILLTTAVLGGWIISARHSGWVNIGLLGLLPDMIAMPCVVLAVRLCGVSKRGTRAIALLMLIGFPTFWVYCMVYATTHMWAAALASAICAYGIQEQMRRTTTRRIREIREAEAAEEANYQSYLAAHARFRSRSLPKSRAHGR